MPASAAKNPFMSRRGARSAPGLARLPASSAGARDLIFPIPNVRRPATGGDERTRAGRPGTLVDSPCATDHQELAAGLVAGDRSALARSITLVESTRPDHRSDAAALLDAVLARTGAAVRVGITGTPGAGKSTFIEELGNSLTAGGHRVAVLALDASSRRSGGSILGDKTRMERLARDPQPSSGRRLPVAGSALWPAAPGRRPCCARPRASTSSWSRRWAQGRRKRTDEAGT